MSKNKPDSKSKADEIIDFVNKGELTSEEIDEVQLLGKQLEEEVILAISEQLPDAKYISYNEGGFAAVKEGRFSQSFFYVYDTRNTILAKLWIDENNEPFVVPMEYMSGKRAN